MTTIDGYDELLALRKRGLRPDTAVLITDSEVIEHQWRDILRDQHPALSVAGEVPPCAVLRIRSEQPHNLIAIRGLPVLALLVRASSAPWLYAIRLAKPGELVEATGADAYRTARLCSINFLTEWLEAQA
jgi:hypothetical protein